MMYYIGGLGMGSLLLDTIRLEHMVNNNWSTHVCGAWSVDTFGQTTIDIDTLNTSDRCDFSAVYRIVFKRDSC